MKATRKSRGARQPAHPHHAHMRHAARSAIVPSASSLYEVRRSRIHGSGVYAVRPIRKGTRVIEYLGDRISHEEADARYSAKGQDDGHTFLFVVDEDTVIDAGVGGNDARFINHSCAPNCDTVIEGGRIYIEALRDIDPGEELGYEYGLTWETTDDPGELANYACRCGAPGCRGTMLDPVPLDEKRKPRSGKRGRRAGGRRKGRG